MYAFKKETISKGWFYFIAMGWIGICLNIVIVLLRFVFFLVLLLSISLSWQPLPVHEKGAEGSSPDNLRGVVIPHFKLINTNLQGRKCRRRVEMIDIPQLSTFLRANRWEFADINFLQQFLPEYTGWEYIDFPKPSNEVRIHLRSSWSHCI